jgi:hypothetical protein
MATDAVQGLLAELTEMGVLTGAAEAGMGVWDSLDDPQSCHLSVALLTQLSLASPSIALAVHLSAMAGALDRAAGSYSPGSLVALDSSVGAWGQVSGRAFAGTATAEDAAILADLWGPPSRGNQRLAVGPSWEQLWWPAWDAVDGWALYCSPRSDLTVKELSHSHGFDELGYQRWRLNDPQAARQSGLGQAEVIDVMAVHAMGLLTIAAGTARRALDRAQAYAHTRAQGGKIIANHDAVARLLADSQPAVALAQASLDQVVTATGLARLSQAWQARSGLHPLLTAAGSNALQVFGGIGYMQDFGAEKDQRDLNTLRRLAGSPAELALRCATLDEALGRTKAMT